MISSVLVVDDERSIRVSFTEYLSEQGYTVFASKNMAEAKSTLSSNSCDAVFLDINLPDGSGLDWIPEIRKSYPDMVIVIITGYGDIPLAVEAMRRGADNFLSKPLDLRDLDVYLQKVTELGMLRRSYHAGLRLAKKEQSYFGESPAMKAAVELASVAASNDSPVVLLGDTGTGKGLLARWIHNNSHRKTGPLVEINCSAMKGDLLSSELFGHAKGAFTSAVQEQQGLIEVADRGTLFLDEICEMDFGVQAQFLKFVEEKSFRRIGEVKVRKSEFRLICATNKDLLEETRHGRFRLDLYFRINVFPILLPSLCERSGDIQGLARAIMDDLGASQADISPAALRLLEGYRWPGNVRELKNVLERAVMLSRGNDLTPEHFSFLKENGNIPPSKKKSESVIDEKSRIEAALKIFDGNMGRTAASLGISRMTLYRRLKKLNQ